MEMCEECGLPILPAFWNGTTHNCLSAWYQQLLMMTTGLLQAENSAFVVMKNAKGWPLIAPLEIAQANLCNRIKLWVTEEWDDKGDDQNDLGSPANSLPPTPPSAPFYLNPGGRADSSVVRRIETPGVSEEGNANDQDIDPNKKA